jgi:hypothetical protein
MGLDTLLARSNTQVITPDWFNQLRRALLLDLLPRNASGLITDLAGSLGSPTIRWLEALLQSMVVVDGNAITITGPNGASSPTTLRLPAAVPSATYPLFVDDAGLLTPRLAQDADFANQSITHSKMAAMVAANPASEGQLGAATESGAWATSNLTPTTMVSQSAQLVTKGRPVRVDLQLYPHATESPQLATLQGFNNFIDIQRNGVTIVSFQWQELDERRPCFEHLDEAPAGEHTYTYRIWDDKDNLTKNIYRHLQLVAVET